MTSRFDTALPRFNIMVVAVQICVLGLLAWLGQLHSAPPVAAAPLACTTIDGGNSYGAATAVTRDVEYCDGVDVDTDASDYFYFDVAPGQIVTIMITSTTTWVSAFFTLYDQDRVNPLSSTNITGAEQKYQIVYMGNSTTPTRYYLVVEQNGGPSNYLFQIRIQDQMDGNRTGDAGDAANTARIITPTLGSTATYTNLLGFADLEDWFRINAQSGQIMSVSVNVLDYGGSSRLYIELDDQASASLASGVLDSPDVTPVTMFWMSNNSLPSAYLLHFTLSAGGTILRYRVQVAFGQQSDGGIPGDAGDDFASARVWAATSVTPTLDAPRNLLGGSDTDDYYLIKLPQVIPGQPVTPYRFTLTPVSWPAGGGDRIVIDFYDAQRNPIAGMGGIIDAPSLSAFSAFVTNCGSDGCYVRVSSSRGTGPYQIQYRIRLSPVYYLYLPVMIK